MKPGPSPSEPDLLDALVEPALILDRDGIVNLVNRAFVAELAREGARPDDFRGRSLEGLSGPLDDSVLDLLRQAGVEGDLRLENRMVWRAGEQAGMPVDLVTAPIGDSRHSILVRLAMSSDISLREQELRCQDRLRILGVVAAGVAHDLNNQLAASMNVASLLKDELSQGHASLRALEIIEGASREAASLAHRLLRFAGRGDPIPGCEPLKRIIDRAALLIRHDLPPPERLGLTIAADLGSVRGDVVQLEQLVVTMLLVAAVRTSRDGRSAFEARRLNLDQERRVGARLLRAGSYAVLETCHSRPEGGDAQLAESLAIARRIAADHGGALQLDDDGKTMQVSVLLPVDETSESPPTPVESPDETPIERPARILVVDDDTMVRDVARAMLKRLGYHALTAEGGLEALEILRAAERPVDLILLDLVMEDLDGVSTLREIREFLPDVPVLISSGFGSARERHSVEELHVQGSLEKPYSLAKLKQALEAVLKPGP